jgi:integrase
LKAALGRKDMRAIDAGDIQRFIAAGTAEGLDPKTIRNHWGTASLIWNAALAQRYVDALIPKPKLPRRAKKKAKFFTFTEVAKIIAASEAENRVFYWLAAETGLRGGELAGLKLSDIDGERVIVNRSVWHGKEPITLCGRWRYHRNLSRCCGSKSHGRRQRVVSTCSLPLRGAPWT